MQLTDVYPTLSELQNTLDAESTCADDNYKKMCDTLYAYMFGTISLLELLTIFERILNIEASSGDQAKLK